MLTFGRGGVHPPEMKLTSGHPVRDIDLPRRVVLSLSQSIGRPAKETVKAGDSIRRFQLVGEAQGPVSANLHSPISGTVKAISEIPGMDGHPVRSVTVEASEEDHFADLQSIADAKPCRSVEEALRMSASEIHAAIADAGIVGLGGATFPTAVKASPDAIAKSGKEVTLLINGAECEPYLTCDEAIMREMPEDIIAGIRLLGRVTGAVRTIVGIEDNKPEAIRAMTAAARPFGIEVQPLRTRYPQGGEKMLTQALTGREIASGQLPLSVGVVVQNVATALAVYHALVWGIPLVERVLTVSGSQATNPGNYRVPIGTPLADVVALAGGLPQTTVEIIAGGTMMGRGLADIQGWSTKGFSGLLMLSPSEVSLRDEDPCVRCARCVDACPMGLEPYLLARLSATGRIEDALGHHIMDCMECGCCSYSCISHRRILDRIKVGKMRARELPRR